MAALKCLSCEHDNQAGAKFCQECGSPLTLKLCKQCEAINATSAQNCHSCGAQFPAPALPQQPDAPRAQPKPSAGSSVIANSQIASVAVVIAAVAGVAYYFLYAPRTVQIVATPAPSAVVTDRAHAPAPSIVEPAKADIAVAAVESSEPAAAPATIKHASAPAKPVDTAPLADTSRSTPAASVSRPRPSVTHTKAASSARIAPEPAKQAEPPSKMALSDSQARAPTPVASQVASPPRVTHTKRAASTESR